MSLSEDVFVARQPIFNRKGNIVGYELLYREGLENYFPSHVDPHIATARVISNSHFHLGIDELTESKPALINLSEQCVLAGIAYLLPADKVILEILETVEPSDSVFSALKELSEKGYQIALDDFVFRSEWQRFLPFVSILKVDIQKSSEAEIEHLLNKVRLPKHLRLLAEKVETEEQLRQLAKQGFTFFQGYFLGRPMIESFSNSDPLQHVLLMVINEVMQPEPDIVKLDKLFARDARLIFKLLRYLNSGQFPTKVKINSINSALRYLGVRSLRRFVTLVVTSLIGQDSCEYLVKQSILYARFAELVATANEIDEEQAFLVGLLSVLHQMLGVSVEQVISKIAVEQSVAEGLLEFDVKYSSVGKTLNHLRQLVMLYDQGKWYQSQRKANALGVQASELPNYYRDAIAWTDVFVINSQVNADDSLSKQTVN